MIYIDFSELASDGVAFEMLCRELLIKHNFKVHWTGVGPDSGRDLIIVEEVDGILSCFKRTWLVSCKHYANSGKSVGISDVTNIVDDCKAANADGYLLICSTHLSSSLIQRLQEIEKSSNIVTCYWDSIELQKRLNNPESIPLIKLFFPKNKINDQWKIYNALTPSLWAANYQGYFFYMQSRTECKYPNLNDIEVIIEKITHVTLPPPVKHAYNNNEQHLLRPRLVSYDNKADVYSVDCDYLYPKGQRPLEELDIENQLGDGRGLYIDEYGESKITIWHVRSIETNQISDHFHPDHKEYYSKIFG